MPKQNLIIGFIRQSLGDRVNKTLRELNFQFEHIPTITVLVGRDQAFVPNDPGEPIHGRDGIVYDQIVRRQPHLMIFDVDNPHIDWRRWVAICKSSAATRRTPIVLIAEEVSAELRKESKNFGANLLAPVQKFIPDLPKILKKLDRRPDQSALAAACDEPLSELGIKGIELFNRGEYFDAHEELEHAWIDDKGPAQEIYKGILQVGVAYLQIERGNYNGAVKMLMRVKQWLDPLPEVCRTVQIGRLREDASKVYEALQALGPDQLDQFDHALLKPVIYGDDS
ncbi:MAG: DUF309 domain-containing protein [Ardenticatenaceae bacterium]|nr:DUF309 domain-containing protein [Ardenticatenaceae bacterium]